MESMNVKSYNGVMINNYNLPIREYNGQRVVTLKDIDAVHGRAAGTARKRFNDHKRRFLEGTDYFKVPASEIRTHNIVDLSIKAQEDITLLTESGYLMLVKSFTDDLAWDVQRSLVNDYFRIKMIDDDIPQLSADLQMFYRLFQANVQLQLKQNQLAEQQRKLAYKLDTIGDLIKIDPHNWRYDCKRLIYGIAWKQGGMKYLRNVYEEIYRLVDRRAGVNLSARLNHRLERMTAMGASKADKAKLSKIEVIASDKKLIEVYISIVKEMAFKEGVDLNYSMDLLED